MKIHIDTDIGGDIDDLCALAMALRWPEAELTGVTTVAEHVDAKHPGGKRAGMVRYVLGLAGREDVPVAPGAEATLPCYRMFQGLPDGAVYWPENTWNFDVLSSEAGPNIKIPGYSALDLLERSIARGAVIAAIGPFTNLALLERRSPGILKSARLVLMGGYIYPPRPGYPAWSHEIDWNVQVDVQSALTVFERSSHPTLVPLAVTVETALRRLYLPRLRQSGPLGRLIARQAEAHALEYRNEETYGQTCTGLPSDIINFQHDPLACAIALGWIERGSIQVELSSMIEPSSIRGVETRELPLKSEIRDGWLRQEIDPGGRPARVVVAVDGERFNELWLDVVAGRT
jgi:inosine-uridine nucleoside N-ribohydrolase